MNLDAPCFPLTLDATRCALCPPLAVELLEYATACQTRCVAGFYADPIAVNVCLPCDTQCNPGMSLGC